MTIAVAPAAAAGLVPELVKALRTGPLAGAHPENIRLVSGGWAATIVSDVPGAFTAEKYTAPAMRSAIAAAIQRRASMITMLPDTEDENRCEIYVQHTSPIRETVVWDPATVNGAAGYAEIGRYLDGGPVMFEIFREDFGSPHGFVCSTTGGGKSEALNLLLAIDRWAHYIGADGNPVGMVASFLIDPQQGQSFADFLDDLAAPVATSLLEATILVAALHREALRRNRYLARFQWYDKRRKVMRKGAKWWDPRIHGPILSLYIDEAHAFLSDPVFSALVTAAARMWRKCGMRVVIATHTPLLSDLGNSMALRDMLTGGFVWIGRTANNLTSNLAFNGRLPVDPRHLEHIPGTAYVMTGLEPKAMKMRTAWRSDWYDVIRDGDDQPIGYPAILPASTLAAFGDDYATWVEWSGAEDRDEKPLVLPSQQQAAKPGGEDKETATCTTAVHDVLIQAHALGEEPLDIDELTVKLRQADTPYAAKTIRDALKVLRDDRGLVESSEDKKPRHALSPKGIGEAQDRINAAREAAGLANRELEMAA